MTIEEIAEEMEARAAEKHKAQMALLDEMLAFIDAIGGKSNEKQ